MAGETILTVVGSVPPIRIGGTLPDGTQFAAAVATDLIVLGVDGRVCAAHPRWMTSAQATRLAKQLLHVATRGSR